MSEKTPPDTVTANAAPKPSLTGRIGRSLSARLGLLTIGFILFAEVVIMIPSLAKHRRDWFTERIESAFLITLALESPTGQMISEEEADELLALGGVKGVIAEMDGKQVPVMSLPESADAPAPEVRYFVNFATESLPATLAAPWMSLFSHDDSLIRLTGKPARAAEGTIDLYLSQAALRRSLATYARNILGLSIIISAFAASAIYFTLNRMIVAPVKRLSNHMIAFERNPEDPALLLRPSDRRDEIGVAERSLAALESRTQALLSERRRLAALGAGISKISHDLRNILASAQLMSDRLAKSDDPRVRKLSPRLISALDRAIGLSRDTLSYARMGPDALKLEAVNIAHLVDDVFADIGATDVELVNDTHTALTARADPTQLYRALLNLVRNAVEAITQANERVDATTTTDDGANEGAPGRVVVKASSADAVIALDIEDTGPGVPEKAQAHFFEPFKGSMKPGGSGLGVAIAHEIARAHGGRLTLIRSGPDGAALRLTVPASQSDSDGENARSPSVWRAPQRNEPLDRADAPR